jgi:uncharacterized protein YaaN involved in tellurite resistance
MVKKKSAADNLGEMFSEFGKAIGEIFNDPELKKKAKEFGKSAAASAKTFGKRFEDKEVKKKFGNVGKAAQKFGKNVSEFAKKEVKKIKK